MKTGHFIPARLQTVPLRDERWQSKLAAYGCLDSLTGVLNHSMIQAHLKEFLSMHLVYPVPFSVMCFRIDHIEELRNRYGKAGVEEIYRVIARAIESGLRPTDFLGRWMDKESLSVLAECNQHDVQKSASA
jgi:diguanylate cyclase (GGDEF)-like protein